MMGVSERDQPQWSAALHWNALHCAALRNVHWMQQAQTVGESDGRQR